MFQHPKMDHKQLITWTLANQALNHPPGEHYAYSNFGYCIVGRVIEKVTGQPYEKHVRNAILAVVALRICAFRGTRWLNERRGK